MFLPELEKQPRNLFFVRPRRFGKSLFLSMLYSYYDCNQKESFEKLFGNLWIGQHPTSLQGIYQVLFLDFSQITGKIEVLEERFNAYLCIKLDSFAEQYAAYYGEKKVQEIKTKTQYADKMQIIFDAARANHFQLYLIIDEYDHFTNQILAHKEHETRYREQTHGEGYLRHFFDTIKGAAGDSLGRIFVTGVSPVTMDDLTSGFNIGTNYSLSPEFNEMVGFTEDEVREMLAYYASVLPFRHSVDELIEVMKPWYDNYCFSEEEYGKTTMYNSVMVLYFVDNYIRNDYDIPKKLVETNIRIDYDKIRMLIRHDREFTHDASIIQDIVTKGFTTGTLMENFPAECINDPDNFLSLLFYFGMVTIGGTYQGTTRFVVPNEVVRDQMYTYLLDTYKENDLTFEQYDKTQLESKFAYEGAFKPYFAYIADCLKRFSSQRDKQKGEAYVHGFTLAMTSQCKFYRPISELDNDGGYADIFLLPLCDIYKDMEDSYIVELKYCKPLTSDEQLNHLFEEASAQIRRYADSDIVRESVKTTKLHQLVVIYRGAEMAMCEEVE